MYMYVGIGTPSLTGSHCTIHKLLLLFFLSPECLYVWVCVCLGEEEQQSNELAVVFLLFLLTFCCIWWALTFIFSFDFSRYPVVFPLIITVQLNSSTSNHYKTVIFQCSITLCCNCCCCCFCILLRVVFPFPLRSFRMFCKKHSFSFKIQLAHAIRVSVQLGELSNVVHSNESSLSPSLCIRMFLFQLVWSHWMRYTTTPHSSKFFWAWERLWHFACANTRMMVCCCFHILPQES